MGPLGADSKRDAPSADISNQRQSTWRRSKNHSGNRRSSTALNNQFANNACERRARMHFGSCKGLKQECQRIKKPAFLRSVRQRPVKASRCHEEPFDIRMSR